MVSMKYSLIHIKSTITGLLLWVPFLIFNTIAVKQIEPFFLISNWFLPLRLEKIHLVF